MDLLEYMSLMNALNYLLFSLLPDQALIPPVS